MRLTHALLISALAMTPAGPVLAQSEAPDEEPLSESIERAFRELMDEVGPAIDELSDTFDVFNQIDSLEHYQPPEVLPNGDIIIRRREDAPLYEAPEDPGIKT